MRNTREVAFDVVRHSQQVFRLILDGMARPGKVAALPQLALKRPAPWSEGVASVALTMLDQEVTFAALGEGADQLVEYVRLNTMAKTGDLPTAEFVFASGGFPGLADVIRQLNVGSLEQPHRGATLVLDVSALSAAPAPGALRLTLSGPGIFVSRALWVAGLPVEAIAARNEVTASFPLGFEMILVDPDGQVVCLPRTTRCRVEDQEAWAM